MGENSKIEWTDHTFNPWTGCTKVSPACDNCYAERDQDTRFGRAKWGKHGKRYLMKTTWADPPKWNKQAAKAGVRARVFCASLADVFEDHPNLPPWRERLWSLIEDTPHLDWLLLTKRPGNILKMMPGAGFGSNVWLGSTVESQEFAKGRIKQLLRVPATVHFLSCEPLLGPLDLAKWLPGLDWVIAGGESGPGARPTDPQCIESLRDQCIDSDVAFHFKQWGNWAPGEPAGTPKSILMPSGIRMYWTTKKAAGRLLGGRTWDEVPAGGTDAMNKPESQTIMVEVTRNESEPFKLRVPVEENTISLPIHRTVVSTDPVGE